jgi:nicotinamide phosphoribosyltransferase
VVENTSWDFPWLTNHYETLASCSTWLPCTSATTAYRFRKLLNQQAELTGTDPEFVGWQAHDFSFRGLGGVEAASMSGAAHLLSFVGTDTVPALDFIEEYYWGDEPEDYLVGGSVAATEHSVMCAGGEDNELETCKRLFGIYPSGILAAVMDTWDLFGFISDTLPQLKEDILARDGKFVIRPDSGNPILILCGDPNHPDERYRKGVVELLWDLFGGTTTATGHRLLDSHIGTIYGDAITYERCQEICERLAAKGFASGNVVFGIGSYTYQYVTRDVYGLAMKATWAEINGVAHDLFKRPATDDGEKFSAKGRLAVHRDEQGKLFLINQATPEQEGNSLHLPTWQDGKFLQRTSISRVRNLLWAA